MSRKILSRITAQLTNNVSTRNSHTQKPVCHPASPAYSAIEMDHASVRRLKEKSGLRRTSFSVCHATAANRCDIGRVTIDILPDDVLLIIFDYYVADAEEDQKHEEWQKLVHVCQNWRCVTFGSPLRLNLRILCSAGTPTKKNLALWPPLPIILRQFGSIRDEDNIIAALGHNDRICQIDMAIPSSLLERVFAAMQKTFAALKDLHLYDTDDRAPIVPDSFLSSSAPHLQSLWLNHIQFPFPGLRNLLFSAPNLVALLLDDIPHSGYLSPEGMVSCLSALTRLKILSIGFKSSRSQPPREGRRPPPSHTVLPALTNLTFIGGSKYLEDLVTWIDAPLLDRLYITFFHQLKIDSPQLVQFISRTPSLMVYDEAHVIFYNSHATIALRGRDNPRSELAVSCRRSEWELSSLEQVCTSSIPQVLISMLERLYILGDVYWRPPWQDDFENTQWMELFHPFATVKNLYLSWPFVPYIMPALQEPVGERVTNVLPSLQSIFLEDLQKSGFVQETIRQFIAARQLSRCPMAIDISYWTRHDK